MHSWCRGIVVTGRTNTARTQMIEAVLKHLTGGNVFITSCGVDHTRSVHPLTSTVLSEIDVPFSSEQCAKGMTAVNGDKGYGGSRTYDVAIAVSDKPCIGVGLSNQHQQKLQRYLRRGVSSRGGAVEEENVGDDEMQEALLNPTTPSHWGVASSGASVKQDWRLYTVVESTNASEVSTNKFQEHYAGEPLWLEMVDDNTLFRTIQHHQTWHISPLSTREPMEREVQQLERFRSARDDIVGKCMRLLKELQPQYEIPLLVQECRRSTCGTGTCSHVSDDNSQEGSSLSELFECEFS